MTYFKHFQIIADFPHIHIIYIAVYHGLFSSSLIFYLHHTLKAMTHDISKCGPGSTGRVILSVDSSYSHVGLHGSTLITEGGFGLLEF